jgi:plasmid stability protein
MRTTLNLDDDILAVVRERARRERRSVGEVLSDLARQALTGRESGPADRAAFHGFRPLPHRGRLVSNDLVDQLREDEGE